MKKILLIATGGTIASRETDGGLAPGISSQALLDHVPEAAAFCEPEAIQLLNIDSTNIQPEHWLMMVKAVEENFDRYDGFVITHGTDTMAYTAAALSYLIQTPGKPIILTGSQKPLLAPISDAKKNLTDALRFACQDGVGGVYLVIRRVISPRIPLAYLGAVALITLVFPKAGSGLEWMAYSLLSGGVMLGAIFMATDYATSPATPLGQLVYGVGCGVLTVVFRYFGLFPEGVTYAILLMNALVWVLDYYTPIRRFGTKRGGAAK